MSCFSRAQLRGYLLQETEAKLQSRVEEHLNWCDACRHTLDELADDHLVREYHEASRRDADAADDSDRPATRSQDVAGRKRPQWQPFGGDDTPLPLQFDRFLLKQVLGSGGFGVVYRAEDLDLGRDVAIKIPHLGGLSPQVRDRFLQEGTAAACLHHPHIVQVHQAGVHRGVCFLVSEYCPGQTLAQRLEETSDRPSLEESTRILIVLAEAVDHAHRSGIVHRDIKPANVVLDDRSTHDGLPFCPKLTDFGTAKFVESPQSTTGSQMLIGTAPYIAPEQLSGSGQVGPACDVYALGVLLYELIAGELPIQGDSNVDTLQRIVHAEPIPLHRQSPKVPRDLSAICARCLEKSPRRRYATAELLARDLRRFLNNEPTLARPLGPGPRMLRWCRRNPLPLTIMLTLTLTFALIVCGLAWHSARLSDLNGRLLAANRRALDLRDRAEQSELHSRRLRYGSDMRLAEIAWRKGDPKSAREVLARYEPAPGAVDLRGLEWHFLDRAIQPETETVAAIGGPLYCIRLSPDQQRFATAGRDGIIRIHERATGALLQSIDSGQGEVNSVAFSPDGEALASAGDDGSVRLWRVADGKPLAMYPAHEGLAFGVEFTPDARSLFSCGSDGKVHEWKNGQRAATHRDHASRVEAIAVSPDGRWLASVGKDRTLVVRDIGSGELYWKWDEANGTLSSVAFSPDSKTVAVVEAAGETTWLRLFDLASRSPTLSRQNADGIRSASFSPSGERVLITDDGGAARIWSCAADAGNDEGPLDLWRAHDSRVYAGVFEPDGGTVLTAGEDGHVRRWRRSWSADGFIADLRATERELNAADGRSLHSVVFHPPGGALFVAAHFGIALLQPAPDAAPDFRLPRSRLIWTCVATPRDGSWVAVAGSSGSPDTYSGPMKPAVVERWETTAGPSRTLLETSFECSINDLECSPAGDLVAVVIAKYPADNNPKQLLLLDGETGKVMHEFPAASGTQARFSRDGRLLVYGVRRTLHVVELSSQRRRLIEAAHTNSQNGLAVSDDGKWLATSDEGRELKIWNLATLQPHAALQGHQGRISGLCFSPDSHTLLSSSQDGTVKAWSVATGQLLMNIHLGNRGVSHMALSADGSRLAIIEDRQQIRVYAIGRATN